MTVSIICILAVLVGALGIVRAVVSVSVVARGVTIVPPQTPPPYPATESPPEQLVRLAYQGAADLIATYKPYFVLADVGRLVIGLFMVIGGLRAIRLSRVGWEVLAYAFLFAAVLVVCDIVLQFYVHAEMMALADHLRAESQELKRQGWLDRADSSQFDTTAAQIRLAMNVVYATQATKLILFLAALNYLFRPQVAELFRRN